MLAHEAIPLYLGIPLALAMIALTGMAIAVTIMIVRDR